MYRNICWTIRIRPVTAAAHFFEFSIRQAFAKDAATRHFLLDRPYGVKPAEIRHFDIHQYDVGFQYLGLVDRLAAVSGRACHLNAVDFQEVRKPLRRRSLLPSGSYPRSCFARPADDAIVEKHIFDFGQKKKALISQCLHLVVPLYFLYGFPQCLF